MSATNPGGWWVQAIMPEIQWSLHNIDLLPAHHSIAGGYAMLNLPLARIVAKQLNTVLLLKLVKYFLD